jgi:hypothetical protein
MGEATGLEEEFFFGHLFDHLGHYSTESLIVRIPDEISRVDLSYDVNDLQTAWWLIGSW